MSWRGVVLLGGGVKLRESGLGSELVASPLKSI